ncbi:MAG: hypothetical protein AABP62_02030 [Planctomycetota bacterium]
MALMHVFVCLAVISAEPTAINTNAGVADAPAVPISLVDPNDFLKVLPPGLTNSIKLARDRVNRAEQQQNEKYFDRRAKQLLVHLTPTQVRVFTANRLPEDKDLLDRVLPPDELAITCDGMEQLNVDGKQTWKFVGNTRLHATKIMATCHEVRIRRDDEHIHMTISGGRDWSEDPNEWQEMERQPTHPEGAVCVMSNRNPNEPHSYESGIVFRSALLRLKLQDGGFLIKTNAAPSPQLNDRRD